MSSEREPEADRGSTASLIDEVAVPVDGAAQARRAGDHRRRRTQTLRRGTSLAVALVLIVGVGVALTRPDATPLAVGGTPPGSTTAGPMRWERVASPMIRFGEENYTEAQAVWTGTEMIVVGSSGAIRGGEPLRPSMAFNPRTGTARSIPSPPRMTSDDTGRAAIWNGSEVVVAGTDATDEAPMQAGGEGEAPTLRRTVLDAYNPDTDTWRQLPDPSEPVGPRSIVVADRWVFVAMRGGGLARLDPASLEWAFVRSSGLWADGDRTPTLAWDGTEITLLPITASVVPSIAYNPKSGEWRRRGAGFGSGDRVYGTDGALVKVNGAGGVAVLPTGALEWVRIPQPFSGRPATPGARNFSASMLTPGRLLRWGGRVYDYSSASAPPTEADGSELVDLRTGTTTPLPAFAAGFLGIGGVWTGTEPIVWGFEVDAAGKPKAIAAYRLVGLPALDSAPPPDPPLGTPEEPDPNADPSTASPEVWRWCSTPERSARSERLNATVAAVARYASVDCVDDVSTDGALALMVRLTDGRSLTIAPPDRRGFTASRDFWMASDQIERVAVTPIPELGSEGLVALGSQGNAVSVYLHDQGARQAEIQISVVAKNIVESPSDRDGATRLAIAIGVDLLRSDPTSWWPVPQVLAVPIGPKNAPPEPGVPSPPTTNMTAIVRGTLRIDPSTQCVLLDNNPVVFGADAGAAWDVEKWAIRLAGGGLLRQGDELFAGGGYLQAATLDQVLAGMSGLAPDDPSVTRVVVEARRCAGSAGEVAFLGA